MGVDRGDTPDAVERVLAHPAIVAALAKASDYCTGLADKATVRRYIRANEGDVQAAAAALAQSIAWRSEARPELVECPQCMVNPHSHNLRVVGIDDLGRPVLYSCHSQAVDRFDAEANLKHLMRGLEDACAIGASRAERLGAPPVEKCVWIIDFEGYLFLKDSSPKTGVLTAALLAHYPERLGRAVLVDAPRLFAGTWSVISRILNPITASKVTFVRTNDGSLETELKGWVGSELRRWLVDEMRENRSPSNMHGEKEFWSKPMRSEAHDPRAERSFLSSPEFALTWTSRVPARACRGPPPLRLTQEQPRSRRGADWARPAALVVAAAAVAGARLFGGGPEGFDVASWAAALLLLCVAALWASRPAVVGRRLEVPEVRPPPEPPALPAAAEARSPAKALQNSRSCFPCLGKCLR